MMFVPMFFPRYIFLSFLTPVTALTHHNIARDGLRLDDGPVFSTRIRETLEGTFNHQEAPLGRVQVHGAHPGAWHGSEDCDTPRLWVFLTGEYRSFDRTQHDLLRMAAKSSQDCFYVAAVISHNNTNEMFAHIDVEQSLKKAQERFGGRLAYVIVNRTGLYDRPASVESEQWNDTFNPVLHGEISVKNRRSKVDELEYVANLQGAFDFYWLSVYHCADLAASALGLRPSPSAVVLRTRPDMHILQAFDFTSLRKFFRESVRGYHLMFGGETSKKQADVYMITSWLGYKMDIAKAYEHSPWMARNNGAGYGWSICGWRTPCSIEQAGGRVWIQGPVADVDASCKKNPLDYSRGDCCIEGSCPMTLVEHSEWPYWPIDRGDAENYGTFDDSHVIDLAQGVLLVCPSYQDGFVNGESWGGVELPLYSQDEDQAVIDGDEGPFHVDLGQDRHYYRSSVPFDLFQNGHAADVWPAGC